MQRLPFDSGIDAYNSQAEELLASFRAGDAGALEMIRTRHPRFLDEHIPWLPKRLAESEIRASSLDVDDARLALARWYDFANWAALSECAEAVSEAGSPVSRFEAAVEAVINGNLPALRSALDADAGLVRARSSRITCFDPPPHRATLLHYVAANGVEGYRQQSPANAVEVARTLLEAGAEPDALADMYGGQCTTLSMLVSSTPPAEAGVQVPLVDTLVDFGAAVDERGSGEWVSPLLTALVFGFQDAAEALARRGARVDLLPAAAGLGRVEEVRRMLPRASAEERHRAFALAAQLGHAEVVELLLDAGEDPNRYNPRAMHAHSTPLHQAALAGHFDVVRLLVRRGARVDMPDKIYDGTPQGWAEHGGRTEIAKYLAAS